MHNIARAETIRGWMSRKELLWLASIAAKPSVRVIIEIGTYAGRSTRVLGDNISKGGVVHSVDPYLPYTSRENTHSAVISTAEYGQEIKAQARTNLSDLIEAGTVNLWSSSEDLLNHPSALPDFVFLDGAHDYENVKHDIDTWLGLVKKGGLIAGHDYGVHEGVARAVRERFDNGSLYRSQIAHPAGSIWAVMV